MCAEPVYPCEVKKASKRSWSRLDVSVRKRSGNIFQSAWLTSLSYFKEQQLYEAVKALTLIKDIPQQLVFLSN